MGEDMSSVVESKTTGRVSELTLITPIKQGFVASSDAAERPVRYAERLRAALEKVEALRRPSGLDCIATIHFARWVIFDDRRLLFTSNFDGAGSSTCGLSACSSRAMSTEF